MGNTFKLAVMGALGLVLGFLGGKFDFEDGVLPPWPLFTVGVAVNDALAAAFEATTPPKVRAIDLATGYWQSSVTYAVVKHGIVDAVAGGEATCEGVAAARALAAGYCCRYMAAAAELGIFARSGDAYALTAVGAAVSDGADSMRDFVLMINEESAAAWRATAATSMASGASGFREAFGSDFFEWHAERTHAAQWAQFDRAMGAMSADLTSALAADYAVDPAATICDVGGGRGHVLAKFLDRHDNASGLVLDLPDAADRATENLARFGGRGAAVGGSFFDAFPPAFRACDVFVVRGVLMDWPDAEATTILRRVAQAAKPGAKLVVNEFVLGTAGKMMERAKHLMDLNMAASCAPGARVRAVADHRALLEAAGVDLASFSHLRIRSIVDVLEVTF